MIKEQVKAVLDRVLTWPPERQKEAARVLTEMEAQDESPYHLTDEQLVGLCHKKNPLPFKGRVRADVSPAFHDRKPSR